MTNEPPPNPSKEPSRRFADQAAQPQPGLVREFWDFLRYNKKWWLTPILVVLLLVSALAILTSSAVAPFIYTLF